MPVQWGCAETHSLEQFLIILNPAGPDLRDTLQKGTETAFLPSGHPKLYGRKFPGVVPCFAEAV